MISKKILAVIIAVIVSLVYLAASMENNTPRGDMIVSINKDPYILEYSLPPNSAPNGLVVDENGLAWVSTKNALLFSVNPSDGLVQSHKIQSSIPYENTNATMVWAMLKNNGKIWFSPYGGQAIWSFDPVQNVFDTVKPSTGTPFQMKASDGKIWFTTLRGNSVGVIDGMHNGTYHVSEFSVRNNTGPAGIFLDKNSLWIADVVSQNIAQYAINQQGNTVQNISLVRTIPQNNSSLFSSPTDLHVYKDVIWLTEHGTSFLARYDIDNGTITRYPTSQNTFHTTTLPFWIRATQEPNVLWFNEHQGNKIGRFDLSNKTLTEYSIQSLPHDGYLTYPLNISQDPRDEKILWFSEWNTDKIGMINGHVPISFTIHLDDTRIILHQDKSVVVNMDIPSNEHPETIFLNASSTITPTAELGNLDVKFSSNMVNTSHDNDIKISILDNGVLPGNYTLGLSASNGLVTNTKFIDLTISDK